MRCILCGVVATACGLMVCGTARAGVYNPGAPPLSRPGDLHGIRLLIGELRSIPVNKPRQERLLRAQYLQQEALLKAKPADTWTLTDRISLSACYIRLLKFDEAIEVLRDADQSDCLVLLHLAAAYHGQGNLRRACDYQEMALKAWSPS